MSLVLFGSVFVLLVTGVVLWLKSRSEKDHRAYLSKLDTYKLNGGKCYKALRLDATVEERAAWQQQEDTNKKALELAGLKCLRAGSYVYFRED